MWIITCHAGSGLIAATQFRRNYVGVDINPEMLDHARGRFLKDSRKNKRKDACDGEVGDEEDTEDDLEEGTAKDIEEGTTVIP